MALQAIGTSKLQLIIEAEIDQTNITVARVLHTFLATDLHFPKRFDHLRSLLIKSEKQRFVGELVFFKAVQMFLFTKLSTTDEIKVRDLINRSVDSMLATGSKQGKDILRGKLIAMLERSRLIK